MSQRLVVKILVSVLDAFHFDLSRSRAVECGGQKGDGVDSDEEKENIGEWSPIGLLLRFCDMFWGCRF